MATNREESLSFGGIPSGIQAEGVLKFSTLKGLAMNLNFGTLKNWKDVADKIGYSLREIEGVFAHGREPLDPCYSVLKDWIFHRKGTISQLCQVFKELELLDCLSEVERDVEEYLAQSNTKKPTEDDPGSRGHFPSGGSSLVENSETPSSLDNSLPGRPSCAPSESSDEYGLQSQSVILSDDSFGGESMHNGSNQTQSELENTSDKSCTEQTDNSYNVDLDCDTQEPTSCGDVSSKSQAETSALSTTCLENVRDEESVVTQPSIYRTSSCPVGTLPPTPPSSPPQQRSKGKLLIKNIFRRSVSVDENNRGKKKFSSFLRKHSKKQKKTGKNMGPGTDQVVTNSESKTYAKITVEDVHVEVAEKQTTNFSPVDSTQPASTGSTCSSQDVDRQNSSTSEVNQTGLDTHHGMQSGYSNETDCHPHTSKMNSSKRLFVLCHKDGREDARKVFSFFEEKGYNCYFHAMDVREMAEKGPYRIIMEQLSKADFVLICLSAGLKGAFEDLSTASFPDDEDRALRNASTIMVGDMGFHCQNPKGKYMPLLFREKDMDYVPFSLLHTLKYKWKADQNTMISVINGRPQVPLSKVRKDKYVPKSKQVRAYNGK